MSSDKFWAVVEVMGHQVLAGEVSEHQFGGVTMVRVDVPPTGDIPGFSKFLNGTAIFSLTPCSEDIARQAQARSFSRPITFLDWPKAKPVLPVTDETIDDQPEF